MDLLRGISIRMSNTAQMYWPRFEIIKIYIFICMEIELDLFLCGISD